MKFVLFLFLRFSSSRGFEVFFTLEGTNCERTSMMKFTLEKLKTCIVQSAILVFTDFTSEHFWIRFQKFAVLKEYLDKKVYVVSEFS